MEGHGRLYAHPAIFRHPMVGSMVTSLIRKKVGNIVDTLFWCDLWVVNQPLQIECSRLYILSLNSNRSINSFGF